MSWSAAMKDLCCGSSIQGILTKCFEYLENSENNKCISGTKFLDVQIIIHLTALSESGDEKKIHCEIARNSSSLSLLTKGKN